MVRAQENHTARRMAAARLCALLIVLTLFLSTAFLVKEADHECTGTDCPICSMMVQCSSNIHLLGAGLAAAAIILFFLPNFLAAQENCRPSFLVFSTLVAKNIRMND